MKISVTYVAVRNLQLLKKELWSLIPQIKRQQFSMAHCCQPELPVPHTQHRVPLHPPTTNHNTLRQRLLAYPKTVKALVFVVFNIMRDPYAVLFLWATLD